MDSKRSQMQTAFNNAKKRLNLQSIYKQIDGKQYRLVEVFIHSDYTSSSLAEGLAGATAERYRKAGYKARVITYKTHKHGTLNNSRVYVYGLPPGEYGLGL